MMLRLVECLNVQHSVPPPGPRLGLHRHHLEEEGAGSLLPPGHPLPPAAPQHSGNSSSDHGEIYRDRSGDCHQESHQIFIKI